jgi:hypothetical protein
VNWSPSAVLSDDLELTGSELSAVKYQLAVRLCPHFGREPSQALMGLAGSSLYKLQRNQMVRGIAEIEVSAPASEGWRGVWDITR